MVLSKVLSSFFFKINIISHISVTKLSKDLHLALAGTLLVFYRGIIKIVLVFFKCFFSLFNFCRKWGSLCFASVLRFKNPCSFHYISFFYWSILNFLIFIGLSRHSGLSFVRENLCVR